MVALGEGQNVLTDHKIVDVDVHINPPAEAVAKYMEKPHRDYMLDPTTAMVEREWNPSPPKAASDHQGHVSGISNIEDVQEQLCQPFNIDYPIINMLKHLPKQPQSDLAVAMMRAYNDLLLDEFLDVYDHVYALATLTTQKPALAADEIDRMADESNVVGGYISNTGAYPPLGDPSYDIMYDAAEANDFPMVFHSGAATSFKYEFPRQHQGLEKFLEIHVLSHMWTQMLTLTSLIVQGVPVKFPDLDFVILEAGIGWVPAMMYRLNKDYSMLKDDAPLLEQSPEEYIRESFYFGTQPIGEANDPNHIKQLLEMVGPESLMLATDFPHFDFDHPEALDKYLRHHFTPDEREAVLFETPVTVFGIHD